MQIGVLKLSLALLATALCMNVQGQPDIQRSHIEANVPPPGAFERLLVRDLKAYFGRSTGKPISAVKYITLRNAPTQSGVGYPKYYLWLKVFCGSELCAEGAVRVACIERERFEVTEFLSRDALIAAPEVAGQVFPAALLARIYELAGGARR